jgi:hypothetical protein
MYDFWWSKWHWGGFSPSTPVSSVSSHSTGLLHTKREMRFDVVRAMTVESKVCWSVTLGSTEAHNTTIFGVSDMFL